MGKRYQETWIKGPAGLPHQRDCAPRYEPIKAFLKQYRRPFSVFDLGANMGYFSFRIAEDFPQATVIAVDDKPDLLNLAAANGLRNVIVLPHHLDGYDLAEIADCEAVDVVLALNVLHHVTDWDRALMALYDLGSHLIVETPIPGDTKAANPRSHQGIYEIVERGAAFEMLRSKSHVTKGGSRAMLHWPTWETKSLARQSMDVGPNGYQLLCPEDYRANAVRHAPPMSGNIVSLGFTDANIKIQRRKAGTIEDRNFIPGMNLWNLKLLGATWPKRGDLESEVAAEVNGLRASGQWMDDLRPWNFVVTHNRTRAIDLRWKAWRKEPEPGGMEKCLAMLRA